MNLQDVQRMRRRFIKDDIEEPEPPAPDEDSFLSKKKLRFVAAWTGNLIAAARAAGYKDPKSAAYKLMKDPKVVTALHTANRQTALQRTNPGHLKLERWPKSSQKPAWIKSSTRRRSIRSEGEGIEGSRRPLRLALGFGSPLTA